MSDNVENDGKPAEDQSQMLSAPTGNKRWYVVHAYSGMETSASSAPACRNSLAASWSRPRKW